LHVICSEWRLERYRFVQDATKRPYITLVIVGLVPPHLWAGIVRSACLCVEHAFLGYFGHVHVSQLCGAIFVEKDICTLKISVKDHYLMKAPKPPDHLNEHAPYVLLLKQGIILLVVTDLLKEVSRVSVLHHYTILLRGLFLTIGTVMARR